MIGTCKDCPNFASCQHICPKVEKLLPEFEKYSLEIPVSQFKEVADEDKSDKTRPATIDDFRVINPVANWADDIETEWDAQWDQNPLRESPLTPSDYAKINLEVLILDRKIRGRFEAFLKCAKITEIAVRSNTTKQNIQKQFQSICNRIKKSLLHRKPSSSTITPHQVKTRWEI